MRSRFLTCLVVLTIVSLFLSGCVRRRMSVASNPPGATVYMDGKMIGRTPFSYNFDFYGKREFRLVKEGYETKTKLMRIQAPWYQWPGIDFVTEVLLPGKLTDRPYLEFDMEQVRTTDSDRLVVRAEDFRRLAHSEGTIQVQDQRSVPPPVLQGGTVGSAPVAPPSTSPYGASPYISDPAFSPIQPPAYAPGPAITPSTYNSF